MDFELQNKSALVTGASRGIGLGIATALKEMGCRLMLNAREAETLQAQAQYLGRDVKWHPADVRDPAACRDLVTAAIGALGGLDILVCNVGSGRSSPPVYAACSPYLILRFPNNNGGPTHRGKTSLALRRTLPT